jgi:hypothetical protein
LVTNRTSTYGALVVYELHRALVKPKPEHANDAGDKYDEYHDSARTEV